MLFRSQTRTNLAVPGPRADAQHGRSDRGVSMIEVLIGISLLATVVAAVVSAVGVTVKATAYERAKEAYQQANDKSKFQRMRDED